MFYLVLIRGSGNATTFFLHLVFFCLPSLHQFLGFLPPQELRRPQEQSHRSSSDQYHSSMASTVVLFMVFILDLVAFALAVAAEQRRSTATVIQQREQNSSYCQYETDIATGLGVGAFLFLLVGQVVIMVVSKCFCCGRGLRPSGARAWAVILFITCWVTFLIAEACLLAGSVRNAYHTRYRSVISDPPSCETLRRGVFGAGAAFIFFTAVVSKLYYICYGKAIIEPSYGVDTGVGMSTY